jgi:hypothetical protein
MDISKISQVFVNDVSGWFDIEFVPTNKPILGVSFVPIHLYARGDPNLIGKYCVVVGKERGGIYTDKFNFFGGKMDDKIGGGRVTGMDVAQVLFEEVYEELHIALTPFGFKNALLDCIQVPYANGVSLVFVVHVKGLSRGVWDKEHQQRENSRASWKYVEMSAIEHIPVASLIGNPKVSKFVADFAPKLAEYRRSKCWNKGVHLYDFKNVCVRGRQVFVQ